MPKPSVSSQTIQGMLQERWGAIADFTPLTEGLGSQAFCFRHSQADYVVRINRSIEGFAKDRFVYDCFSSRDLPVPQVLEIGRLDDTHAFCISRRMPGVRFKDMDDAHLAHLVRPSLQLLERIGAADIGRTRGFGCFDVDGVGPHAYWHEFLTSITDRRHYDWEQFDRTVGPTVRTMCRLVKQLARRCPEERRLVHGDFGSCNVLTDGHRITAIIDWDRALFGDPLYDIANLLFWGEKPLQPLVEWIKQQQSTAARWDDRVFCYQLRIGLQEIYDSATGTGTIDLTWLTNRCNTIVEQGLTS